MAARWNCGCPQLIASDAAMEPATDHGAGEETFASQGSGGLGFGGQLWRRDHLLQRHGAAGECLHRTHAMQRYAVLAPLRNGALSQRKMGRKRSQPAAPAICIKPFD